MAIDIPHIWLYLAELVNPVLREGGISMRELFRYGLLFANIIALWLNQYVNDSFRCFTGISFILVLQ